MATAAAFITSGGAKAGSAQAATTMPLEWDRGRDGVISATPPSEPDGRISPVKCGAPHLMRYVAKEKMWRRAPARPYLLPFHDFLRHILFRLRESSPTSFGENRVGVFKYLLHLAVVFSRHADGPLVEDRKAFLKYPTSGNTCHSTLSRTLRVLNKMWRRKPETPNKGVVFRAVRHIFSLATYPVRLEASLVAQRPSDTVPGLV